MGRDGGMTWVFRAEDPSFRLGFFPGRSHVPQTYAIPPKRTAMQPTLGQEPAAKTDGAAPAPGDLIKESSERTFVVDVIEASKDVPVLVDFWAPWCGPCRQLTPILEKVVREAKGAVKLVKINIDENQRIAAQMRIQALPAVYACSTGQPID